MTSGVNILNLLNILGHCPFHDSYSTLLIIYKTNDKHFLIGPQLCL